MAIPAVGVANWIKGGSSGTAVSAAGGSVTLAAGDVYVPKAAVTNTTGTMVPTSLYSDDIRDFLTATLDSVYKTYSALASADKPTTFQVQRNITSTGIQYTIVVNTSNLSSDFPTWA